MIIESLNEYLEALAGYIHDDDKLVTYKWLSKELEVHVNVAKQVLWEYWQKHHEEGNIEATIMLMGSLKEGGMRVEVVKQSNLATAKIKFSKIISEHIYSLQKALPDISLLAISGEGDVRFSAIKCDKCVERDEEELSILRWGAASKDHIEADKKEQEKAVKKAEDARKLSDANAQQKSTDEKPSTTKKSPKTQQAGFGNFFGKSASKPKNQSTSAATESHGTSSKPSQSKKESPKEKKPTSSQKKAPKNGIDSFFSKNMQKEEGSKKSRSVSPESKEPKSKESESKELKSKEPPKRTPSPVRKRVKDKKKVRGVKRGRSSEESTIKKRKRIIIDEHSSDSNASASDTEEMDVPPSPERVSPPKTKSPTPPRFKHEGGKKRVLKVVDKTFQDEDGYLVTQKVHVYESCSEDEAEVAESKPVAKPDHAEPKNKKKKQATLMNFFKK